MKIFDGKDLAVFSIGEQRHGTITTFGSWLNSPYGDKPIDQLKGFGQEAFAHKGFKEIHIIPRKNHWYQTTEMSEVMRLVKSKIKTHNNWTYGGSMGGYAAINFSENLNTNFIAFCPQFSVDKRVVPFEYRWVSDRAQLDFICDYIWQKINRSGFVFFDPYSPDQKHAELIESHTNAALISCPFAGHNLLRYAQETHGLFNLVLHILQEGEIPKAFNDIRRANRGASTVYLSNAYKYCVERQSHRKRSELYKNFPELLNVRLRDLAN